MKDSITMKRSLWSIPACLMIVALPSLSLAAERVDLERLRKWQDAIHQDPCAPTSEARLVQIHSLRDRIGEAKVKEAILAVQGAAKSCRRLSDLSDELMARLDKRAGRFELATKSYETRGFLSDFWIAGPFGNESGSGLSTAFGPEALTFSPHWNRDEEMPGRKESVRFRPMPKAAHSFGFNDFSPLWEDSKGTCGYAVATLVSNKKGPARLLFGASGAAAAWWNGALVLLDPKERQAFPDRMEIKVQVRAGANRVLVKTCAELQSKLGFYLRITNDKGDIWPWTVDHQTASSPTRFSTPPKFLCTADTLVQRAFDRPSESQSAGAAAWYLLLTGADDPRDHIGRDLAKRACELAPSLESCGALVGLALDRSEKLMAWRRAAQAEPSPAVLAQLAKLEIAAGHLDEAQSFGREARSLGPKNLDTLLLESELLAQTGLFHSALESARDLLSAHPQLPIVALHAFELSQNAPALHDAATFARRAHELAADELPPLRLLARRAALDGDIDAFERHSALLTLLDGSSLETLESLAWLRFGMGDFDGALATLEQAVSISPRSFFAHLSLGRLLAAGGVTRRAEEELLFASQLRPQDVNLEAYLALYGSRESKLDNAAVAPEVFLSWRGHAPKDADSRLLVDQWVVEVLPNGLARRYRQIVVELLSPLAARQWKEHWIQSSTTDQRVQILTARVYKTDGSVASGSLTAPVPVSEPWYRLYYDVQAQGIEMPFLTEGDVVEIAYRTHDIAPRNELGGYFGDLVLMGENLPKTLWRYSITTPRALRLSFNSPDVQGLQRHEKTDEDTSTTVFEVRDLPATKPESGMPGPTSVYPYLHISTYDGWESLGKWYSRLVAPGLAPDERLRKEVQNLTRGLADLKSKTTAIHRWVVTNTRYVGLEFGIHGYKPYGAPLVAARGFGDCKDKASLLVTMLKEAGVDAEFALVRTRHRGDLDTVIASLSAFDHAIVYIPSLDLWIDATAEQHGIENLPFADQGVLALRLTPEGPAMGRTPILPAEQNHTRGELSVRLFENGEATIQGQVTTNGDTAAHLRRELETTHTRRERFEQLMSASMPGVKVSRLNITSLDALDTPVSYSYEARLPAYALVTPLGGLEFPVDQGQNMTQRFARLPRRTTDLVVGPSGVIERRTTIHLPEGFEAQSLPPIVELRTRFGSVALAIETRGSQITIHRRVSLDIAQVSPKDYPDFTKFCQAVDEAMSGRVALRKMP